MSKLLAVLTLVFSSAAYAGGPVCTIDGTNKTVSGFTPNGVNWTLKYNDGTKENDLGLALFTSPNYNSPLGYTLTTATGAVIGILTIHSFENDIDHAYGFFTLVENGQAETFPVSCLQYE